MNTISTSLREMERLVAELRAEVEKARAERDAFAVLVYQARKDFWWALKHDGKSGKKQMAAVRESYERALTLGFKGTRREWVLVLGACA